MLPDRYVSISRLREAAQARAKASSHRAVAREIGVALRGFQLFLKGSQPQQKTLEKLLAWYRDHVERTEGPPITASDALLVLVRALPVERRPSAVVALLSTLLEQHQAADVNPPADVVAVAGTAGGCEPGP
jgi:hypothetical protein